MRKVILAISVFLLISNVGYSQSYKLNKNKVNKIKSRTLLVELLEPNEDKVKAIKKRLKKAKKPEGKAELQTSLDNYFSYIESYNSNIQSAVSAYWTLNTAIEFKTTSELRKLRLSKEKKNYSVLWYNLKDAEGNKSFDYHNNQTGLRMWNYGFLERNRSSKQFTFHIPIGIEPHVVFEEELKLYLKLFLKHFEYYAENIKRKGARVYLKMADREAKK